MMRNARAEDRKKDTREKIQLGGLIAKAGLRYEKRALLLGLLSDAKRRLTGDPAERARLLAIGEEIFRNDRQEADAADHADAVDDSSGLDADGDRAVDGGTWNNP